MESRAKGQGGSEWNPKGLPWTLKMREVDQLAPEKRYLT